MKSERGSDAEPGPRPRGRPRDEGADGRILRAAAELMLARGGDAVTVDEVAERAGVGKATVYRRYPSKDEMAARALQSLFVTHVEVPDTGSLREDLRSTYTSLIRFAGSPQGRSFLRLTAGTAVRSERVAALYRGAYEARRRRFTDVLVRAVHRGELDSTADAEPLLDALPALLMLRTVAGMPLPTEDDVERLLDLHLAGATRPASDEPLPRTGRQPAGRTERDPG